MGTTRTIDPQGPTSRTAVDRIAVAAATACGAGFMPWAPGTAGSLVGVGAYAIVATSDWDWLYLPLLAGLLALAVWSAGHVETIYGHDASKIVIDEVVGQMITLGFVTHMETLSTLTALILGFLLFRFFDILKPFPLRRLERLPRGAGVVADDVGAGVYGLLTLILLESMIAGIS